MGPRLAHVHLGDGTGEGRDEHLVPGRGNQPCAQLLHWLAEQGYSGSVTVEVSTRRATSRAARLADLAEATVGEATRVLVNARRHLYRHGTARPAPVGWPRWSPTWTGSA